MRREAGTKEGRSREDVEERPGTLPEVKDPWRRDRECLKLCE